MFSVPLFKQSVKSNWVIWLAMTAVMAVLCVQFAAMEMTQSLLFTIFYGMMSTILPGIYVLITANKLLSSQVDRGSMAYVLSTPTKRSKVVFTQIIYLITSIILMFAITTVAHIAINASTPLDLSVLAYGKYSGTLTANMIFQVNLSAMLVAIALAGVCFMFSGIFNLSKYSIGFSGTFVGVSILANMMAMFGSLGIDALENFKYITICTFYDYQSVLLGTNDWMWKMLFPIGIAIITFAIGSVRFCKKDLPL